ncbi:hypothetical protein JCM11491_006166 [Sporobolomyces phaffii]
MAAPPPGACQPTPISTIFATTTLTSLVPTTTGSTTYVLVDPEQEVVSTTFRTRNGLLEPVRTTVLGATITTTEALTATQTSIFVTSVPVSTILNSCPAVPTSSSTSSSSATSSSSTLSSTATTTSTTTTTSSSTSTFTTSTTPTRSTTLPATSSSTFASSALASSSSASSTGLVPSSASNASNNSSSSPANLSAIIGGSVGGGVGAIILLGLLFWCCCARNRRNGKDQDEWRDPPPFLVGGAGNGHGSGDFEEKEPVQSRWDPVGGMASANPNANSGRLSRKYVGAGAGAALAGGVSAYDATGGDASRRKSGKFRPADEQDAYYRNTWVEPQAASERSEPPVHAGFAGVGAGGGGGAIASSSRVPPPQRQGTFANMMDNATTFDPRARDGGWAVANEAAQAGPSQAQFQPRNQMPPPAPLPLPGNDYRQQASQSSEAFLVPPSQSRFNRYNAPSEVPRNHPATNGYDSPAPSHVSIPALGPYYASADSERGGNQLRVTNLGSSTAAGSEWGGDSHYQQGGDWNANDREELAHDNDPYGGLDAGLDHHRQRY